MATAATWWRVPSPQRLARWTIGPGPLEKLFLWSWKCGATPSRRIFTSQRLQKQRRKINFNPQGVPSWANYDGNQKCIDGEVTNRLIWEGYKRNFKGQRPPQKTRLMCKRGQNLCSNACPICSRELTVEYTNVGLLNQFICPHTNAILPATRTGLCRQQQKKVEAAIEKARDYGLLDFTVPRKFPDEEMRTPLWNKIDVR